MLNAPHQQDQKLILLELNEVNFDVAGRYAETLRLPAFRKILEGSKIRTTSEKRYEDLEPWIQWPSVHSGLTAQEHEVFRLGDMVGTRVPQMFEQLEQCGLNVGCISAMNAENRMNDPAYFIPDPWTKTLPDKSWWSRVLTDAVSQAVNDNAQSRITAKSAFHLALGIARFAHTKHYSLYLRLATRSRGARWCKALLLDLLLHDLHSNLFSARQPDFSTLFLNAGAHIQHHYFFNAQPIKEQTELRNPAWYVPPEADPFAEMLQVYDLILGEYLAMPDVNVIVATGLSQRHYDRVKFYYRLKDHSNFLRLLGIRFASVHPRMTREFLIVFDSPQQAAAAQQILASIRIANCDEALFGDIDNRGASLFVTLTFPREIDESVAFVVDGKKSFLAPHVAFVALKNGMHQEEGFAFFTPGVAPYAPKDCAHVKELYSTVMQFFGAATSSTLRPSTL